MGRPRSRGTVVTALEAPSLGPDIARAPAEWIHETDARVFREYARSLPADLATARLERDGTPISPLGLSPL